MAITRPMPGFGSRKQTIAPEPEEKPVLLPAKLLLPPELPNPERRNASVKIKGTRFQPPKPGEKLDNQAKVDGALLSMRVLQMLRTGKTYLDLSAETGLSPKEAFDAVVKAMNAFMPNLQELAKEVKDIELAKLDNLERLVWDQLGPEGEQQKLLFDEEGNLIPNPRLNGDFVDALLKIQRARRELLGLDAAKRMESKHEEIRRVYIGVGPDDI